MTCTCIKDDIEKIQEELKSILTKLKTHIKIHDLNMKTIITGLNEYEQRLTEVEKTVDV